MNAIADGDDGWCTHTRSRQTVSDRMLMSLLFSIVTDTSNVWPDVNPVRGSDALSLISLGFKQGSRQQVLNRPERSQ